ncbi:hypothetical protein GGR50DRAFT_669844 [Xylaria sp. CBS 124048]|nr:hypothetical protein GGR50DRAFT_669844 [Xylaria sp. CBS 124048]
MQPSNREVREFQHQQESDIFFATLDKPNIAMKIRVRVAWRQCNTRDTVEAIMRKHRGRASKEQKLE